MGERKKNANTRLTCMPTSALCALPTGFQMKKQPYVIVRCRDAGVHAGTLVSNKGRTVVLEKSTRIWHWSGAASLSELAVFGAKHPDKCKFGVKVPHITLLEACEIIMCSPKGEKMIKETTPWRA
jgi:hypothetical protein